MKPGIYFDLSREKYDRIAAVNQSSLKVLAKSPAHYRHEQTVARKDTDALRLGRVISLAVYEPERYRSECVVWRDGDRRGNAWKAFQAEHRGLEILTEKEEAAVKVIQTAVHSDATAKGYVSGGRQEVTLVWNHIVPSIGGVPGFEMLCKARPDFIANAGAIVDLKSARDASPAGFGKAAWNLGYLLQAAFYSDAYEAVTGQHLPFKLVAVEKTAPYPVQVYSVTDEQMELGREQYRDLIQRLHLCRSESRWPGYADGEMDLTLPAWAGPSHDDENVSDLDLEFSGDE